MARMDRAQLTELNALVANEARAWKAAGYTRETTLIIDELLAALPSIARQLAALRRRARARECEAQVNAVRQCFT